MSITTEALEKVRAQMPLEGKVLAAQIESLIRKSSGTGFHWEEHLPGATRLYDKKPKVGDKAHIVAPRGDVKAKDNEKLWTVKSVDGGRAILLETLRGGKDWDNDIEGREPEAVEVDTDNVIPVKEHGDVILPGLKQVGEVKNGGEDPYHVVINGENFHALQALDYTHHGKVDVIYIDPPYNTGAKDWKYNDSYVDSSDGYKHSKWISFIDQRISLAQQLLNPEKSVLMVQINEVERDHLSMYLKKAFPGSRIEEVCVVTNSSPNNARKSGLLRVNEYVIIVYIGDAEIIPQDLSGEWKGELNNKSGKIKESNFWNPLKKNGVSGSKRSDSPNLYYPLYVNPKTLRIEEIGDPIPSNIKGEDIKDKNGLKVVLPETSQGEEGRWRYSVDGAKRLLKKGYLKTLKGKKGYSIYLITSGQAKIIEDPDSGVEVLGYDENDGHILISTENYARLSRPYNVWNIDSHNVNQGTLMLRNLLPQSNFPYPKSLYLMEDLLRFFISDNPNAVVLDFFSGSGTTAHAVMRLNEEDGGQRVSISVTNNEASADDEKKLTKKGLRPNDEEWKKLGIANHVTYPRIVSAVTGKTADGKDIKGDYKYNKQFPMKDGLKANVRFFELKYLTQGLISYGAGLPLIAPLLWMKSGAKGNILSSIPPEGYIIESNYMLVNEDVGDVKELAEMIEDLGYIEYIYVVTNNSTFTKYLTELIDKDINCIQLYDSYLNLFEREN